MTIKDSGKGRSAKRRAQGTGRIYKRGKDGKEIPAEDDRPGVYYLRYNVHGTGGRSKVVKTRLTDEDGNSIRSLRSAKKAAAKITEQFRAANKAEHLDNLQKQLSGEREKAKSTTPLPDCFDRYRKAALAEGRAAITLKHYETYWKRFIRWNDEQPPGEQSTYIREITPDIASKYAQHLLASLLESGKTTGTYNKHIIGLRQVFKHFLRIGELPDSGNPFAKVERIKHTPKEREPFTRDEIHKILSKAEEHDYGHGGGPEYALLYYLAALQGLRLGDCSLLEWSSVDMKGRRLQVRTSKTGKVLNLPMVAAVHSRLSQTPVKDRKGYVLPTIAADYLRDASLATKRSKRLFKRLGITGKTFHCFRHFYITTHAELGTPQAVVEAVVGHGHPLVTRLYIHVGLQALEQHTRAFEGAVGLMEG